MVSFPQPGTFRVVPKEETARMQEKMTDDAYKGILDIISTLQRERSQAVIKEPSKEADELASLPEVPNAGKLKRGKPGLVGIKEWIKQLGYTNKHIDDIDFIHVAGTHGKTSTITYIGKLLLEHGKHTQSPTTIGLYASPHMEAIEERFRVNGDQLSRREFVKYAWDVLEKLNIANSEPADRPGYRQFLTLLSFHVFIQKGVKVAIYECHSGGQFDSTNVIPRPNVTAITQISKDYSEVLGSDLHTVAWHYSGIFKSNVPAFSVKQNERAARIALKERANEKSVELVEVDLATDLPKDALPAATVQLENFSLARAVCKKYLEQKANDNVDLLAEFSLSSVVPSLEDAQAFLPLSAPTEVVELDAKADM